MKNKRWTEEEVRELKRFAEDDWNWQFPGWQWVADQLRDYFGTDRTATACRSKWYSLYS